MVSKYWANALMREWTAQALLEEEYQLKQTVMSSNDPLKEAESQIFFISTFAKPLLELTVRAAPNLSMYYHHCKANLQSWRQRKALQCDTTRQSSPLSSPPPLSPSPSASSLCPLPPRQSDWYHSAFPLALPNYPPKLDSSSRTSTTTRSSDHGSRPHSPCESESVFSAMHSPISDCSYHYGLSTSSNDNTQNHIPSSHAAIRSASKSGSVKLQSQKKRKSARHSWCSSSASSTSVTTIFQPTTLTPISVSSSSSSSTSSTPPLDVVSSSSSSSSYPRSLLTPSGTIPTNPGPSVASILMSRRIKLQVLP